MSGAENTFVSTNKNMNEDQKAAQWAMFRIVQEVDKRLAGNFICFLYSTGSCQAVHHCEPEPCQAF